MAELECRELKQVRFSDFLFAMVILLKWVKIAIQDKSVSIQSDRSYLCGWYRKCTVGKSFKNCFLIFSISKFVCENLIILLALPDPNRNVCADS